MKLYSFDREPRTGSTVPYFEGFMTNLGSLVLCNLYFLLCCLPIVTIGPSLLALCKVCTNIARGRTVRATRDFFAALKENFLPGLAVTITVVPVLVWNGYMMLGYLYAYLTTGQGMAQWCLFLFMYLIVSTFTMYLVSMLVHLKANMYTVLRNTVLCCMIGGGRTIFGGLSTAVLLVAGPLCLPASLPLMVGLYCSFVMYHASQFSWKVMDQHIFAPYYAEHPEDAEDDGYH